MQAADHGTADRPKHPVIQRWWARIADIMQANPRNEPLGVPLETMSHTE
jgi:L-rhamnose mutarotase